MSPRRWWREPMMWLVLGLPLSAVLAGTATLIIAVQRPDPVVAAQAGRLPAVQGRNHAAAPTGARP